MRNLADHPAVLIYGFSTKNLFILFVHLFTAGIDDFRLGKVSEKKKRNTLPFELNFIMMVGLFPEGGFFPLIERLTSKGLYGKQLKEFNKTVSKQVIISILTEMLPNPENRIIPSTEKI